MNSELPTSNIIIIIKFAYLFVCLINVTFIFYLVSSFTYFLSFFPFFCFGFFFSFFFLGAGGGGAVVVSIMTVTDWRYCL